MSSVKGIIQVTEPFKIFVGDGATNKLMSGSLDKGKTAMKSGTASVEVEYNGGTLAFPNYWAAWGRRVINGNANNSKGLPVDVNEPEYRGEVEFLDNKSADGYLIYCRYVQGIQSLDYDYQTLKLNLVKKEADEKNLILSFERGEHKIEPQRDRIYALAIKVHPMNSNSTYKADGFYKTSLYKEVNVYETQKTDVKALKVDFQAKKYVEESSTSFAKLKVLHNILSEKSEIAFDKSDENTLYDSLMLFADEQPDEVIRLCNKYKQETSQVIEIAKSHNQFDTSKDGILKVGGIKKETLLDEIPSPYKGEDMVQYLFDKAFDPKVFDAINKLHELRKTFK